MIKRKNEKGYELLEFFFPDDAQEDDFQSMFHNLFRSKIGVEDSDENLLEGDLSCSKKYLDNAATAFESGQLVIEATGPCIVSLSNLCNDPYINKDAMCLYPVAMVIEMDAREIFFGHLRKIESK